MSRCALALVLLWGCERSPDDRPRAEAEQAQAIRDAGGELEAREPTVATPAPAPCADERVVARIGDERLSTELLDTVLRLDHPDGDLPLFAPESVARELLEARMIELGAARLGVDERQLEAVLAERPPLFRRMQRSFVRVRSARDVHVNRRALELVILATTGALDVSEQEVRDWWEQKTQPAIADNPPGYEFHDLDLDRVELRSIVVTVGSERPGRATITEARAEAERIAALLRAGVGDFDELVRRESDARLSDDSIPGAYGVVTAKDLDRKLARRVFAADAGEVLIVEIEGGFEVFEIVGRWGPGPLPFEAYEEGLRSAVMNGKAIDGRERLLEQLYARYVPIDCVKQRRLAR